MPALCYTIVGQAGGGSYISWGWVPKCDDFMKITSDNKKMLPKCDDIMKMTPKNGGFTSVSMSDQTHVHVTYIYIYLYTNVHDVHGHHPVTLSP